MKHHLRGLAAAIALATAMPASAALLYQQDFEAGTNGISGAGYASSTQAYAGLGYGSTYWVNDSYGGKTRLTVNLAQAVTGANLSFSLAVIDSWDSYYSGWVGPDAFNVDVNGSNALSAVFENYHYIPFANNGTVTTQAYRFTYGARNGGFADSAYLVSLNLGNLNAGAHTFDFYASGWGWQGGYDESFGLDNLQLTGEVAQQHDVPEPATALLLGLGLAGLAASRKKLGA